MQIKYMRSVWAGRPLPQPGEESPDSAEQGCRVIPGRREATESAAERIPPMASSGAQARVKGCGKSAPRSWQQVWHGKPHPEQGQEGTLMLLA